MELKIIIIEDFLFLNQRGSRLSRMAIFSMVKMLAEQAPIAPIYQYTNGRLIKPWLKGYPITNPEDVAYSRTMYLLKHD